MPPLAVIVAELEPIEVARFHAFGAEPENLAGQALLAWATPLGYLQDRQRHRVFGFNNPDPSERSPEYGYELWMIVGPNPENAGETVIRQFPGGLYAVTRCLGAENIGATWAALVRWVHGSRYDLASHQWLEEHLNPEVVVPPHRLLLDLYAPISPRGSTA